MKAEKIDHVAFLVRDLDKAIKFFSELFETEFPEPWVTEGGDFRETIDPLGIDLVTPHAPDGVSARRLARRGEHIAMVSFKVSNLEQGIEQMKAKGVRMLFRQKIGNVEYATFHPLDTFGVWIELIQYKPMHGVLTSGRFAPRR